MATTDN